MKRKRHKQITRDRLLDSATRAFVESGFRASTLRIARKTSVAHGTVFFHFKSRNELILTVVRRLVLSVTEKLYNAYAGSNSIEQFLSVHFQTMRSNWRLIKALLAGFSDFSEEVKHEIIALLGVANYYLVESFNRWVDQGLVRTMFWQGVLVYLSFFGDYMFEKKNISEEFMQRLLAFMCATTKKQTKPIAKTLATKTLCQSCGMILHMRDDFAKNDLTSKYCKYCTTQDGSLKSFAAVLDTMTDFFMRTQVLKKDAARKAARAVLARNPAWRHITIQY